jgi:hypothetical protein
VNLAGRTKGGEGSGGSCETEFRVKRDSKA